MINIRTKRSVYAKSYYHFVDEKEWHRARNALEFLDLEDDYKNFFDCYKKKFQSRMNPFFRNPWIIVSSRKHKYPFDGCRVHLEWSSDKTDSIYFHTSIKNRNPDWIGRNIFLEYLRKKLDLPHSIVAERDLRMRYTYRDVLNQPPTCLELGESAVHFFQLATLCGFDTWKNTYINNRTNFASEVIFKIIYPSILRWLYQNREEYPLLTAKLLHMFCDKGFSREWLFCNIPNKQHLEFLLGVANQAHFYLFERRFRFGIALVCNFQRLEMAAIIARFMQERRFELITVLLLHGYTMDVSPSSFISLIVRRILSIGSMEPEFNTLKKFLEMFRKLIISRPLKFPCNEPSLTIAENRIQQRDIVEKIVDACERMHKDGDVYKLQHMCRSVVRQRLGDNFLLPTGIYVLDIPKRLKEYLNLDSAVPGGEEVLF